MWKASSAWENQEAFTLHYIFMTNCLKLENEINISVYCQYCVVI